MGTNQYGEIGGIEEQFGITQAWHGLTIVQAAPFTWFDLQMQDAAITRPVELSPLGDLLSDDYHALPDMNASVRSDGRIVGVNGGNYGVMSVEAVYEFVEEMAALSADADTIKAGLVSAMTLQMGRRWGLTWESNSHEINGVKIQDHVFACGSFDGSMKLLIGSSHTIGVCQNTLALQRLTGEKFFEFKNTKTVTERVDAARRALRQAEESSNLFEEYIVGLQQTTVGEQRFQQIINTLFPIGDEVSTRARNANETARDKVQALWRTGVMAEGHDKTAWAAVQAVNTFENWDAPTRATKGQSKEEVRYIRQWEQAVNGTQPLTHKTLELLLLV